MPEGPVLFASDDSPEALADAKAYIARFGLTRDDVTLTVRRGQTLVIAKRNVAEKLVDKPA
jgi:hypothetical protein